MRNTNTFVNQSYSGKRIFMTQDIPVRVISPQQAEEFREPLVPEPQVRITIKLI